MERGQSSFTPTTSRRRLPAQRYQVITCPRTCPYAVQLSADLNESPVEMTPVFQTKAAFSELQFQLVWRAD